MEQTRDTAGLRARVAVEELAAAQRAEVEKLEAQMADLQQGVEERLRVLAAELRSEAAMRCAEVRAEMLKLPEVQVSRLELDVQESPQPGSTGYDKATELDSSLGSLGSFGSLKESTEQLRRCLKDLAQAFHAWPLCGASRLFESPLLGTGRCGRHEAARKYV
ncbi:unnamed protein product, partial [Effrenium voratum]